MAKADMFLRLEGKQTGVVKGESNAPDHPDEIEITDWSWGMSGSGALGGAGAGVRTTLSEIKFGKGTDKSTTALMSVMRANDLIPWIIVMHVHNGGALLLGMIMTFCPTTESMEPVCKAPLSPRRS